MLMAALLAEYREPGVTSYLLVNTVSAKPLEITRIFLAWPLRMSGTNRLKRWTLPMTLTSNRSLRVLVSSSGFAPLFVLAFQSLVPVQNVKANLQISDGVVGIEKRHDTSVADEVVEAPTGDLGRIGGSFLLNTVSVQYLTSQLSSLLTCRAL
jgi:hypothetical protein